jgi:pyruvate,orthophosphate dikinase
MTADPDRQFIVDIAPDAPQDRALLGGKATSLVLMTKMGAPVPPGFVLTTNAYRAWAAEGDRSVIDAALDEGLERLQNRTGLQIGTGVGGLVVSVRSGSPVSMPGMMETVLNVGLGPLPASGAEAFAYDARARFLLHFSDVVLGLNGAKLDSIWQETLSRDGGHVDPQSVAELEASFRREAADAGVAWPESPDDEIRMAANSVMLSWESKRAKLYRKMRKIDDGLGTAVTVQQMVFGNHDPRSGSGVAFTRDPNNGKLELVGEFLAGGQGEEIVSGRATPQDLETWRAAEPELFARLDDYGKQLESEEQTVQEIEFTVDAGALYLLQSRAAKLTIRAAARAAVEMVEAGTRTKPEAVQYAAEHGFDIGAAASRFRVAAGAAESARGLAVGGGVAAGRLVASEARVLELAESGPVVFVAEETSPKHLQAMQASSAVVTMRGGATSHAAVVARELGIPCVVGVGGHLDGERIVLGQDFVDGDLITVDGDAGALYAGDHAELDPSVPAEDLLLLEWAQSNDRSAA